MTVFFTSDTHYGHANIIKYSSRQYADVADMNSGLIAAWNSKVGKNDIVYHLGDLTFGDPTEFVDSINGRVVLIPGNHDRVNKYEKFVKSGKVVVLPELHRCSINGQYMTLCHYSLRVWDRRHHGAWHLFGHSHGTMIDENGKSMDVGVDTKLDNAPYAFDEIKAILDQRSIGEKYDHH